MSPQQMSSTSSFAAEPGKRLWAGGFDFLTSCVIFLVVSVVAEQLGFDFAHWAVFGIVFFIYHFGCLVVREGRTLGKTAIDICVVSTSGQKLSTIQCFLRASVRAVPFFMLSAPRIDIFGAFLLLALVVAEFYLLEHSPTRQTVADKIANSLVVKLPPLQPHRAPSGPMFSANDSEFGYPPRRPPKNEK